MSYSLEIRPDALIDIEKAAEWYEEREPGLGIDFSRTVIASIESLSSKPLRQPLRNHRRNVCWLNARRFPYRVVYQIRKESITVLAVLHTSRHDRQWKRPI